MKTLLSITAALLLSLSVMIIMIISVKEQPETISISRDQYSKLINDAWQRGRYAQRRIGYGYNIEDSFKNDTAYLNSQYDSIMIGKSFKPLYK